VSQSPVTDLSEQASLRYKQGWRALNRLLHEDRSFSGRERNCAFVNCAGPTASFATASAVTGFDFPDDGRGLATVDWDFDGDLDVWLTNRTAPRVRFLKNQTAAKPFVAVKLSGDGRTSNRDAIGARIELHLQGAARHPVRIRTLRGGEGFLSQSSNWIHFGLGDAAGIEKLVVRWPGGPAEEYRGLQPGGFYRLSQGGAAPRTFQPAPPRLPLVPSTPDLPALGESARIVVPPGLPLPALTILATDGREQTWEPRAGRPTVVNLWASWCAPCLAELSEWAAHQTELAAAGVEVVAFNTEGVDGEAAPSAAVLAGVLQKAGFTWPGLRLTESGLHALDHLNRAVLDRWTPLPLPTTFLVDARGEVAVIYKGPVPASQLVADLKLAEATATGRRAAATPFAGRWLDEKAGGADPRRVAGLMLDHDEAGAAIRYLDRSVATLSRRPPDPAVNRQVADLQFMTGVLKNESAGGASGALAALTAARDLNPSDFRVRRELAQALFAAGRAEEAAVELLAATTINPTDLGVKNELADLCLRLDRVDQARGLLEEILAATPKDGMARYRLAGVLAKTGDARGAIRNYRQALSDAPRLLAAANDLARLLAGHPDAAVRSADEALALAQRLAAITKEKDAGVLDTLALALANKGEFKEAVEAANKALALIPPEDEATLTPIRARLRRYEAGQPGRL